MTPLGTLIERRRTQLGMSRASLAQRIGVSVQTIVNVERDENYNLGTRLIRQLEAALGVEFVVTLQETQTMENRIDFGIDECILYLRKNYPNNATPNNQLGKLIAEWLRSQPTVDAGELIRSQDVECLWGAGFTNNDRTGLPATSTQLRFSRALLPALFTFLDNIGGGGGGGGGGGAPSGGGSNDGGGEFDPEVVIAQFDEALRPTLRWLRRQVQEQWPNAPLPWGNGPNGPNEAWLPVRGMIEVRFLFYTGPTGQHIAIWTGKELRETALALIEQRLGFTRAQVDQWGANTDSINIPVIKLVALENQFAVMSVIAALAQRV